MVTRDPEAKKRQLLAAALAEFAEHGIAGTRVDGIAERAGCSPGLVYTYYGSKEGLFDAVLAQIVTETVTSIPITADDLPEYAGRLFDGTVAHPEVARVLAWHQLERGETDLIPGTDDAARHKIDEIRAAQGRGVISAHFDAEQLLLLVQGIAAIWATQPHDVTNLVAGRSDHERRRATVVDAVRQLLAGARR